MKRSFSLSSLKPKGLLGWAVLLGGIGVGAYLLRNMGGGSHASANFANSNNSIYPVHDADLGDSMNSVYPFHIHSQHMFNEHGGHGCGCGGGGHKHHKGALGGHFPHHHRHGHKTFPDYTDRINQLPTPFFGEHNSPYDSFNIDANLQNLGDKGLYIQTFNGNTVGSP